MPEKHNIENYKVNLFLIKDKIECKIDETKCKEIKTIKNEVVDIDNKTQIKEIVDIDNKTLRKEIFVVEYQTKIVN